MLAGIFWGTYDAIRRGGWFGAGFGGCVVVRMRWREREQHDDATDTDANGGADDRELHQQFPAKRRGDRGHWGEHAGVADLLHRGWEHADDQFDAVYCAVSVDEERDGEGGGAGAGRLGEQCGERTVHVEHSFRGAGVVG